MTELFAMPRPRPVIMGILNVTPDSFSDGGRWIDADAAVAHAGTLHAQGADIIDVGGESTRPGAERVPAEVELERVLPVVRRIAERGIPVSIDTMNARTAAAAIGAGAVLVNDVSGGLGDPEMLRLVAASGVHYCVMHWRGQSAEMQRNARYGDVVREVRSELEARLAEALVWGVHPDRLIVDPGLGFAKEGEHNWQLLGRFGELTSLGPPVLVGASRKRFLGALLPEGAPVEARDAPTATVSALAAQAGAWGVRVHDVTSTRAALEVWAAWNRGATA